MFKCIGDVLHKKNGKYMCVTLAESFIFTTLIEYYTKHHKGWKIDIDVLRENNAVQSSPFLPLLITIQRAQADTGENICISFDINTGALFEIEHSISISIEEAIEKIPKVQEYAQKCYDIGFIKPRRYEQYDLWDPGNQSVPRFTIMIIDSNATSGTYIYAHVHTYMHTYMHT